MELEAVERNNQPNESSNETPPAPTATIATSLPQAELTRARTFKLSSAAFCFFNAGVNDGALGALIPYILDEYLISTAWMAIPYGVGFVGWLAIAVFGGYIRMKTGTGGVLLIGAFLQFAAQLLRFWVPPFGLFSVTFFLVALGQALQDSQANTFVAGLKNAHRYLGLIHGCYAIGGLVGPLMAAAIASNLEGQWAAFYYVPLGIGAVNLALCFFAFRDEVRIPSRSAAGLGPEAQQASEQRHSTTALVELRATLKLRPVWLLSVFFFLYLGAAITIGGWVVEFLVEVRDGNLSNIAYIASAFYGGLAAGRFLLAEPTFRLGEWRTFLAYVVVALTLEIVFWQVANVAVDAVMVSFIGFLLGPAFATGVSVGSQLIPSELQASGLAMIFVVAQAGGAIFPAITGVIASKAGVGTLQPIVVGLLAATLASWAFVPNPRRKIA
ncbi:MFS general substrate transporter [Hortaea werneckii]|nr:MFS general substrate transporter [Hortaea werneckii]